MSQPTNPFTAMKPAAPVPASDDPLERFLAWYDQAARAGVAEPEVVALATATRDGKPSVRMVLYRGRSGRGLRFFTNYQSRKAHDLDENPRAALAFFWTLPERRQVRVEGPVERLPAEESDAYFRGRPRDHQIGAWVSPQSQTIAGRDALVARQKQVARELGAGPVPRPEYWGGYRIVPEVFEFWTAAPGRLHERVLYRRVDGGWTVETLAP